MSGLSVNVSVQGLFLRIAVSGENSVENVLSYLTEVHSACFRFNCPFVLVEENLSGPALSIEEIFSIVSAGSMEAWPVVQVLACVDLNPLHIASRMQMAEKIADGAGIKMKWFETSLDAEQWLLKTISK